MAGPTRWGIVGSGNISHDFVSAMKLMTDSVNQVSAVAARTLTKASAFNDDFGKSIPRIYGSYKELAQDDNVDIVYIGVVTPRHYDTAMMMLEAGKNVLVETSMAVNLRQVQKLIATAKEKKLFLAEGYWTRCFPIYDHLREELSSQSIGDVHTIMVNIGFDVPAMLGEAHATSKDQGRGAMLDIGCYAIMLATMIFDEKPERICASGLLSEEGGVDIYTSATLYYQGKRRVQFNVAIDQALDNTATIYGTKGSIKIPEFWAPDQLITPSKTYDCPLPLPEKPMKYPHSEGFVYEISRVRDCLLKGEKTNPLMPLEHTLIIHEVMDEIRKQLRVVYDADNE